MSFEYQLIRSRRRTLELRVYPDHRIEVRAPMRCSMRDINEFVNERRDWVEKRLNGFVAPVQQSTEERFSHGSEHYYLGNSFRLLLSTGRSKARFSDDALTLYVTDSADPSKVEKALDTWYRRQAQQYFSERLDALFPAFAARGFTVPPLTLRKMRSRWGSLSQRTGMTLNTELIKTPPHCIDYVVVHELCHLEHMNHGPGFKGLMTKMMPDWTQRKKELNQFQRI